MRHRLDDRLPVAGSSVAGCFARPRFFEEKGIEIFPGVSLDPGIRFGKPCLAGTRIDIATVVGALGAGLELFDSATAFSRYLGKLVRS